MRRKPEKKAAKTAALEALAKDVAMALAASNEIKALQNEVKETTERRLQELHERLKEVKEEVEKLKRKEEATGSKMVNKIKETLWDNFPSLMRDGVLEFVIKRGTVEVIPKRPLGSLFKDVTEVLKKFKCSVYYHGTKEY